MRPTLQELAESRRKAQWFLATMPDHSMAKPLRTLLAATAPITKDDALPVMIRSANEFGGWVPSQVDKEFAELALESRNSECGFRQAIRAQWATLVHFMGGAE